MSENLIHQLAGLGIAMIIILLVCLLFVLIYIIKEVTCKLKRRYRYKHRYDKKPLAKCYCKDCRNYFEEYNHCVLSGMDRSVPTDWFCKEAIPYE